MKTVLVTGANGYIGRHVIDALLSSGAEVIAIDRSNDSRFKGHIRTISIDIFEGAESIINRIGFVPDACLHLAWSDGFNHNSLIHIEHLPAHFQLIAGLVSAGVDQVAVMGSMHEIGYWEGPIDENTPCSPLSLYGIAKNALRQSLEIELPIINPDVTFQWIRGYYIYGDDFDAQSIFGKILRAADGGQKVFPFTTGKNQYDFIPIDVLATQIAAVVMQEEQTGIINCCSGNPVSLAEQIELFIHENGLDISLEYGAYPDRPYDSPGVWGDANRIKAIMNGV